VSTLRLVNRQISSINLKYEIVPGVREAFRRVLDRIKPDVVHFHHLINLSVDMVDEVKARGIPAVASLHDFWYLCRRVQLYIPGQGMCEGPEVASCSTCFDQKDKKASVGKKTMQLGVNVARRLWGAKRRRMRQRFTHMKEILAKFDIIFANSEHLMKRYLDFGVSPDKIKVLYYGFEIERFERKSHPVSGKVRFGYMGSIVEHKGVHHLVEAFRRLPEARLFIWGDTEADETVRNYRRAMKPPENVRFMGGFDHNEINTVLGGMDVLIVPSLWEEAYGIIIDEAKLAGIPVIASRVGGIPEHIRHNVDGFLFTPGDVDELEGLIRRFVENPGLVEELRPLGDDVIALEKNKSEVEESYLNLQQFDTFR
jgi:glycosyltransferase involved in cell wall biosynthesis